MLHEDFASAAAVASTWTAVIPDVVGAEVMVDGGALRMSLPEKGALTLRRALDAPTLNGHRVRISARIRTSSSRAEALVALKFGNAALTWPSRFSTRTVTGEDWTRVETVVDIAPDRSQPELALELSGAGKAWFEDVSVESLGPAWPPAVGTMLTTRQLANLDSLARATALIRYRHPSDQAASLDWDEFLVGAIERVLRSGDRNMLLADLREIFHDIAPTVEISTSPTRVASAPPQATGAHLTRWLRFGLGDAPPYAAWRHGRDRDLAILRLTTPIELRDLRSCRSARLQVTARRSEREGDATIYAQVDQPGEATKRFEHKLTAQEHEVSIDISMPADSYRLLFGIQLLGGANIEVSAASLTCGEYPPIAIDLGKATWTSAGMTSLHEHEVTTCEGRACVRASRIGIDRSFVVARDELDTEIGNDLWLHMPLAVWSDGAHTFPLGDTPVLHASHAPADLPERLATIISAWGTISLFYPYLPELHTDWHAQLAPALSEAAAAHTLPTIRYALLGLLTKLRDNHARVFHADLPIDGALQFTLRRFGDHIFVVGGVTDYAQAVPLGSELLAIDGVPAIAHYDSLRRITPAATPGWSEFYVAYLMTLGPIGTFASIRIKTVDGKQTEIALPRLSRTRYDEQLRPPLPEFGAELAPKVFYIDLNAIKQEAWTAALPKLTTARAIILDMRGYPSPFTFSALGHFVDQPLLGPRLQVPVLETGKFELGQWSVRPVSPRLRAQVFVLLDGGSASAAETVLQLAHDNHIGTFIGEPSAGTNGNRVIVNLPGGFSIWLTAMRVEFPDGSLLQGRGIQPDVVVQPTADAMRAGRDEVLEAAVARARELPMP